MIELEREKFYEAIFDFLSETMNEDQAKNQSNMMVDNIIDIVEEISTSIKESKSIDVVELPKKFHTLKNLLLYGDFYYESDLCQDIEIELRKSKKISSILSIYNELIDSLKM